ncbi:MAG: hypothetical protein KDB27_17110 [Planctomycetales bacterium]|nr:hypothetical protein [Planctomycetales bacterium]
MTEAPLARSNTRSTRKRYRAPTENGGTLIDPPLNELVATAERNRRTAHNSDQLIADNPIGELRASLRRWALEQASTFTNCETQLPSNLQGCPLFVSGHQPQLFHPGVWFKNHLLEYLRSKHDGIGLHVIIDNDLCTANSIRVPTGTVDAPVLTNVPFDDAMEWIPFEERTIHNSSLFESFGDRVTSAIADLVPTPLIQQHWRIATAAAAVLPNLGFAFSKLRHNIEREWGAQTLEVPLSHLCRSREFHLFVLHFIRHRAPFVEIYNRSLEEYRRINRIRSRSHPVPPLSIENEWCELPFWVWQSSCPRRRALLVRTSQNTIELTNRSDVWRIENESKTDLFLDRFAELEERGIKIRPRALMTTMFLRLLLSDLFIHGIGGAKYDELTDQICRELGLVPPAYACATSTLRLPVEVPADSRNRIRETNQLLRQYRFHPERFIPETESSENQVSKWIQQKEKWINRKNENREKRLRHAMIEEANRALQRLLQEKISQAKQNLEIARHKSQVFDRLGSREFSFVLFPDFELQSRMQCEFSEG